MWEDTKFYNNKVMITMDSPSPKAQDDFEANVLVFEYGHDDVIAQAKVLLRVLVS